MKKLNWLHLEGDKLFGFGPDPGLVHEGDYQVMGADEGGAAKQGVEKLLPRLTIHSR